MKEVGGYEILVSYRNLKSIFEQSEPTTIHPTEETVNVTEGQESTEETPVIVQKNKPGRKKSQ